jgi:chromosome segregation ATPase
MINRRKKDLYKFLETLSKKGLSSEGSISDLKALLNAAPDLGALPPSVLREVFQKIEEIREEVAQKVKIQEMQSQQEQAILQALKKISQEAEQSLANQARIYREEAKSRESQVTETPLMAEKPQPSGVEDIQSKLNNVNQKMIHLDKDIHLEQGRLLSIQSQIQTKEKEVEGVGQEIAKTQQKIVEVHTKLDHLTHLEKALAGGMDQGLVAQEKLLNTQLNELQTTQKALEKDLKIFGKQEEWTQELDEAQTSVKELQSELESFDDPESGLTEMPKRERDKLMTELKTMLNAAEERAQNAEAHIKDFQAISAELSGVGETISVIQESAGKIEKAIETLKTRREELTQELQGLNQGLTSQIDKKEELEKQIKQLKEQESEAKLSIESKLKEMKQLQSQQAGLTESLGALKNGELSHHASPSQSSSDPSSKAHMGTFPPSSSGTLLPTQQKDAKAVSQVSTTGPSQG